jgi:hypothetical protein
MRGVIDFSLFCVTKNVKNQYYKLSKIVGLNGNLSKMRSERIMPCNCNNRRNNSNCNNCSNCANRNKANLLCAGNACANGANACNGNINNQVVGLTDLKLATSYVVPQVYTQSYTPQRALEQGTCFPELDMEY